MAQDTKQSVSPVSEQKVVVEHAVIDASSSVKASPSEAPSIPSVNTSLSALEARCKRFGIPFDASKVNANMKQTEKATARRKNTERAIKLEERRKRFGLPPADQKEKEEKKSFPSMHRLRDCSDEERKVLEARMKRFGMM